MESIGDLPFDQARAIYQEAIDEADVDSEGRVFGIADAAPGTVSFEQLSGLHAGYSEAVTKHNADLDRKRGAGLDKKDAVALLQSIDDLPVDQATAIYEEAIDEDVPFEELYGGYFEKAAFEEAQERAEAEFQGGEGLMIDQALTEQYRPKMQREAEATQARLLQEYMDSPQYIEDLKRDHGEGLAAWNEQLAAWKDSPQYIEDLKRDHREGLAAWNEQLAAWKDSPQYIEDLKRDRREGLAAWNEDKRRAGQRPLSVIEDEAGLHPAFGKTGQPVTPTAQPVHDPFSATPMAQPQVDLLGPPPHERREEDTSDHGLFSWKRP